MDSNGNDPTCGPAPLRIDPEALKARLKTTCSDAPESSVASADWRQLTRDLGHRYAPERVGKGSYEVYDQKQSAALDALKAFRADLPAKLERGAGLILYGTVGTGKDHLLAAMLYHAALSGERCRWCNGQDLYGSMRDRMDKGPSEEAWLNQWTSPRVLGLSDPIPPAGDLSPWRMELLYRLVDRRYRAMRSTWATLNVLSPEDADRQLSHQVFDRMQDGALVVPCFWPSYRERHRP
jgi:DNA replication protein DnaC